MIFTADLLLLSVFKIEETERVSISSPSIAAVKRHRMPKHSDEFYTDLVCYSTLSHKRKRLKRHIYRPEQLTAIVSCAALGSASAEHCITSVRLTELFTLSSFHILFATIQSIV